MGTLIKEQELDEISRVLTKSRVFRDYIDQFPEFLLLPGDIELPKKSENVTQLTRDILRIFIQYHQSQATYENLIKVLIENNLRMSGVRVKSIFDEIKRDQRRREYFLQREKSLSPT